MTGDFPTQRACNAENVSIWWRHHGFALAVLCYWFQQLWSILTWITWLARVQSYDFYWSIPKYYARIDTLRPRQYCPPVRIFRCIFLNENVWISPETSQKFVPKLRINNISAYNGLVPTRWQAIILNSHGQFVTRPQWVNYKNALISEIWPLSVYGVGCSVLTRTYPLPVVGHFTEWIMASLQCK